MEKTTFSDEPAQASDNQRIRPFRRDHSCKQQLERIEFEDKDCGIGFIGTIFNEPIIPDKKRDGSLGFMACMVRSIRSLARYAYLASGIVRQVTRSKMLLTLKRRHFSRCWNSFWLYCSRPMFIKSDQLFSNDWVLNNHGLRVQLLFK